MSRRAPGIAEQTKRRLNPRALFRVVDDEAVILDLDRGEYYGLNAVATRVWQMLEQDAKLDVICATLAEEFEVDHDELFRDVRDLLQDLEHHRLLLDVEDQEDGHASSR